MKQYTDLFTKELEDMIDKHDCHASPEDGCDCLFVYYELERRLKNGRPTKVRTGGIPVI